MENIRTNDQKEMKKQENKIADGEMKNVDPPSYKQIFPQSKEDQYIHKNGERNGNQQHHFLDQTSLNKKIF